MSNGQHQSLFQPDLLKDEKIMWSGQPDPGISFTRADIFLIPLSLFFAGFPLVWFGAAIFSAPQNPDKSAGAIVFFYFIGFAFTVYGLYFAFGRFLYKKWKKRRTYYALTNRRALILTRMAGKKLQGVFLDRVPAINKSVRSDGIGTVQFGNSTWLGAAYSNTGLDFFPDFCVKDIPAFEDAPAFYDIEDAETVYNLANSLR